MSDLSRKHKHSFFFYDEAMRKSVVGTWVSICLDQLHSQGRGDLCSDHATGLHHCFWYMDSLIWVCTVCPDVSVRKN